MSKQVAITGYGIITEKGYEKETLWKAFNSFVKDGVKLSNTDFQFLYDYSEKYKFLNSFAQYGLNSFYQAFCERQSMDIDVDFLGVFVGTAFGDQIQLSKEQCKVIKEQGVRFVLPGQNMNKGTQMVANVCAIESNFHGSNYTYIGGRSACAIAIMEAFDDIIYGGLKVASVIGVDNKELGLEEIFKSNGNDLTNASGSIIIEECNKDTIQNAIAYMYEPKQYYSMKDTDTYKNFEKNLANAIKDINENCECSEISLVLYNFTNKAEEECLLSMKEQIVSSNPEMKIVNISNVFGDSISAGTMLGIDLAILSYEYGFENDGSSEKEDKAVIITSDETGMVLVNVLKKANS